jgi:hypothetical protein
MCIIITPCIHVGRYPSILGNRSTHSNNFVGVSVVIDQRENERTREREKHAFLLVFLSSTTMRHETNDGIPYHIHDIDRKDTETQWQISKARELDRSHE